MKTFATAEIERFLLALDGHLKRPFTMIVIGGAAAALAYRVVDKTRDIDTMNDTHAIEEACDKAKAETGLEIPLGPAGVADAPYDYEDRLRPVELSGLRNLRVLVPEKHDLALMKIMRGYEHDLATVEELGKRAKLDLDTLVERYLREMTHVTGGRAALRQNLLAAIERLFGEKVAIQVERRLG